MLQTADSDVILIPGTEGRRAASLLCVFCNTLTKIFFYPADPLQSLPQMLLHRHYSALDEAEQCPASGLPDQVSVRIRPDGNKRAGERWMLDRKTRQSELIAGDDARTD